MKILFLLPLIFGKNIRHRRNHVAAIVEVAGLEMSGDYNDDMTSSIDDNWNALEATSPERVRVYVRSTEAVEFSSGNSVQMEQWDKYGRWIKSEWILKAGQREKWTYFEVRPDDRFVIKNSGNNGVFIEKLKFGEKRIRPNGESSFWIDGDQIQCDASKVNEITSGEWSGLSIPEFTIVNGEVTSTPCDGSNQIKKKTILIKVRSTNDYWYWQGDPVEIVQRNKFDEFIASKIILRAGRTEQSTYFDVGPDDRFLIRNGGNDGVYIKELLLGDKVIKVNGQSSFWIDGDQIECDASNVISVSEFTVVNGEVTSTQCDDNNQINFNPFLN